MQQHLPSEQLVEAAKASFEWIVRYRFREQDSIVLDSIKRKAQEVVDWTFSCITGQLIVVCTALYIVTNDRAYISLPTRMAETSMQLQDMVENGILVEAGA